MLFFSSCAKSVVKIQKIKNTFTKILKLNIGYSILFIENIIFFPTNRWRNQYYEIS